MTVELDDWEIEFIRERLDATIASKSHDLRSDDYTQYRKRKIRKERKKLREFKKKLEEKI